MPKSAHLPQDITRWLARWKTLPLAIMAETADGLRRLQEHADPSPADIARIVQKDPFLVLLLLKAVNGRDGTGFASEVIGIENAVKLVGVGRFFERFGHLPLIEGRFKENPEAYAVLLQQILIARQAADLARDWAIARLDMKPEEVFVAALLHNHAWCRLALHEPQLAPLWQPWHASPLQDDQICQRQHLGIDLNALQVALLRHEGLPDTVVELQSADAEGNPRSLTVILASRFARQCLSGWHSEVLLETAAMAAQLVRRSTDQLLSRSKRVLLETGRAWCYSAVPPSVCWLPLEVGHWAAKGEEVAAGPVPVVQPSTVHLPDHEQLIRMLATELQGSRSFNQTMSLTFKALHRGFGLERVLLALSTPDLGRVKARYAVCADGLPPLDRFEFILSPPNLLSKLMQKSAGIWINRTNAQQFRPHLPAGWNESVGSGEVFLMSLFVGGRAVGLMLADSAGKHPLDEAGYNAFKKVCLQAARSLERLAAASPEIRPL